MKKRRHHSFAVRLRAFEIWQVIGDWPFRKRADKFPPAECPSCGRTFDTPFCPECGHPHGASANGSFYKGGFDSIPFMNDDAKRTFVHLLFRPGYMIMDYIKGKSSRYLSPLAALIIFYAFYALISSMLVPSEADSSSAELFFKDPVAELNIENADGSDTTTYVRPLTAFRDAYVLTCLDRHPEFVDSKAKSALAAFESSLRSNGIFLFLWKLILLTLSVWLTFGTGRKRRLNFSASATVSAYILCQHCFFMLFVLLLSLGRQTDVGPLILSAIVIIDLYQMFGFGLWKCIGKLARIGLSTLLVLSVFVAVLICFFFLIYGNA